MARYSVVYDEDAPQMTDAELAEFRPAREALDPKEFETVSSARRGRPKGSDKVPVSIRLDQDVVEAFKATGKGWQSRVNAMLRREMPKLAAKPSEREGDVSAARSPMRSQTRRSGNAA